jgi:uncharacterized protein (UPF0335 family)
MSNKNKAIDYLFEDPEIPNQKYALVSIIGPHMPQKCDVWGLKIRGTADSVDRAKTLCKKLLRLDNNYDIYTVEVGKFFPLQVEPHQIGDIEYQNDQLNTLVKSYLENKQSANEMWHKNKADMIEQAVKEGQNQEEFANKPEHPIAVLQRIHNYEETISETEKSLESLKNELVKSKEKFATYTEQEREVALNEFKKVIDPTTLDKTKPFTVEEIKQENVVGRPEESVNVNSIIQRIKVLEEELSEMLEFKKSISKDAAPRGYDKITSTITDIEKELSLLKEKLNNKDLVNNYINDNYPNSQYHFD